MTDLEAGILGLPKAELHIHIEGSLEPEMMFELGQRNGVALPYADVAQIHAAYDFANLQEFLDLYYAGMSVLRTRMDFQDLANAYFQRAEADGITRVEFFFDPQAHLERGIALDTVFEGLHAAAQTAAKRGISTGMIMCFLRHLTEADAFDLLERAEPYRSMLIGVGLDSSELGHPPRKFKNVFRAAQQLGLRLVAHAGEEGPPEYVWQALDELGVDRIDHGNRALEDLDLVRRLRADQIPLTVCPLSNLKLCVVDDLRSHPLRKMLDDGLLATVNSDDPAYFGGYLNENYLRVAEALGLSWKELELLAGNSLLASFDR